MGSFSIRLSHENSSNCRILWVAARSGNVFLPLIAGLLNAVNALHSRSRQRHPLRVLFRSPRAAGLFRPELILEKLAVHQQMPWMGQKDE